MFMTTAAVPVTKKKPMIRLGSAASSPSLKSMPMPCQPKTVSVMTAPPTRPAKSNATIVASGIRALRNA